MNCFGCCNSLTIERRLQGPWRVHGEEVESTYGHFVITSPVCVALRYLETNQSSPRAMAQRPSLAELDLEAMTVHGGKHEVEESGQHRGEHRVSTFCEGLQKLQDRCDYNLQHITRSCARIY